MHAHARLFVGAGILAIVLLPIFAEAHGYVGNRFFPATTATDDPFAVDELAFHTVSWVRDPGHVHTVNASLEFDKEIFPYFAIGFNAAYVYQQPDQGPTVQGWDNIGLTAKLEVWHNEPHEFIMSVGLDADVGGTGNSHIGDSFSTISPKLFFGKGFGDLPDSAWYLQPFAVTGVFAQSFPFKPDNANTFEWGFAVQYSLIYLQQHVKDVGLPAPFKDMVPLVEFAMETGENRDERGLTTGTINPGVLWVSRAVQLGVEANIPVNSRSGVHVGVTFQAWIFIDDLFPKVFGHPVFGARG